MLAPPGGTYSQSRPGTERDGPTNDDRRTRRRPLRIDPARSTVTFKTRHFFGLGRARGSFEFSEGAAPAV